MVWQKGPKSGLTRSTLQAYKSSQQLERDFKRQLIAVYYHAKNCHDQWCQCSCNGQHGYDIATDIQDMEDYWCRRRTAAVMKCK